MRVSLAEEDALLLLRLAKARPLDGRQGQDSEFGLGRLGGRASRGSAVRSRSEIRGPGSACDARFRHQENP